MDMDFDAAQTVQLREVQPEDLPIFFEQEQDAEAIYMAAFTAKDPADRAAFFDHWNRILNDPELIARSILAGGAVAGYIVCFDLFGDQSVGYWLGKPYWGQGIATAALRKFLRLVGIRPLFARAVKDNAGSLRVLQKCGFAVVGEDKGYAHGRRAEVEEFILRLDG